MPYAVRRKAYGIINAQYKTCKMLNGSSISLTMTVISRNMSQ